MIDDLDLDELRRVPRVSYYFRYPLNRQDFRELEDRDRLRGHYAAKALYAGYTSDGRVDRSSGYDGSIAALFVPLEARTVDEVSVVVTQIEPPQIVLADGRRNWTAIYRAAEQEIRDTLGDSFRVPQDPPA